MKKLNCAKNILAFAFSVLFFSAFTLSCEFGTPFYMFSSSPVDDRARSVKTLQGGDVPELGSSTKFSFVVITDTHFGTRLTNREEEDFLQKFEELLSSSDQTLRPRFIVNLGDTLNAGYKSEAKDFLKAAQKWRETANAKLGTSDYKIYSILGNHDLYNNGWSNWRDNIWPHTSYYKFNAGGFAFYFLDTGNGTLGYPQFEDLEDNLRSDSLPKLVFMHYPLYAGGQLYFALDDSMERNKLISNFARYNVKYVFEGHAHNDDSYDFKKFKEVITPSYVFGKKFALVTVDTTNQTVEYKSISY